MAVERLIDLNGDDISIASDHERDFDQESLSELDLLDFSNRDGSTGHAFASSSGAAQAAKALEIAEERITTWDEHLTERSNGVVEASSRTPEPAAAPPAYSAAIASDDPSPAIQTSWTTDRMPQSMSDTGLLSQDRVERGDVYGSPEHDLLKELGHVTRQLWRIFNEYIQTVQKKRGHKFGLTKRMVRFIVAALTVIILLAIFLPIIIRAIIDHRRDVEWEKEMHPYSEHPAYKRDPHKDHPNTAHCTFDVFSEYEEWSHYYGESRRRVWGYDKGMDDVWDRNFALYDEVDGNLPEEFSNPEISGTVEIISIPPLHRWEDPQITMRTHVATNKPWKVDSLSVLKDDETNTFTLRSPALRRSSSRAQPEAPEHNCLSFWIGIYIPVDLEVVNWTTVLRSLSFVDGRDYVFDPKSGLADADQVANGAIRVTNTTIIKSSRGNIDISYWNSLQTILETRRGDIRGKYAFHKALNLKTLGGAIDVEVDPQDLPKGALSREESDALIFSTSTGSGNTNISMLHPSDPDWTPHFMESTHRTTSGSLQVHYPSEWAGTIDGITASSHVEVKGQDTRQNDALPEGPGDIHMIKGNRAASRWGPLAKLYVESETGSIDVVIGDVS